MFSTNSVSHSFDDLLLMQGYFHGVAAESTAFAGDAQVSLRSNSSVVYVERCYGVLVRNFAALGGNVSGTHILSPSQSCHDTNFDTTS
jgi:hypothetical protein